MQSLMRSLCVALVAATCLAACSGKGQSSSDASASPGATAVESGSAAEGTAASPAATESTPAAVSSTTAAEATGGSTPAPAPSATLDPNLLSVANGTILRSYGPVAVDQMGDGNLRNAAYGIGTELPSDAKGPYVFTFELPTRATITGLQAALRSPPDNGPKASVTFAVSTTSAVSGFNDIGTIVTGNTTLSANTQARWVRVTANQLYDSVGATGTLASPPALVPTGVYISQVDADKNGAFVPTGARDNQERVRFVMVGSALVGTECNNDSIRGTWIGHLQGRMWTASFPGNKDANPDSLRAVVNDDASIIAGTSQYGTGIYFTKTNEQPTFCKPRPLGTGTHRILVLDQDPIGSFYPTDAQPPLPAYHFDAIGAGMLDPSLLTGKEAVIARATCKIPNLMAVEQIELLLKWAAAGHKLTITSGSCPSGSDFKWLAYPFVSAGPGPETHNASLIQIENSGLGTNDKNDAVNFVDVSQYVANANNALTAASVVTTDDPHWCGHFFVAKPTNLNGFVQMYAVDRNGLLLYDGFNDDGSVSLARIRQLELALPVGADLPCTQHVTESFILEPNQELTFASGQAQTMTAPMRVLANQGWSGTMTVKTTGDLPATVRPSSIKIAGGTLDLGVDVHIPSSAKPGVHTVTVTADNGGGKSASATVTLNGTAPLRKQFTPAQKRIRIYGIHFDVDSAVIQTRSEPVIAEIAQLLKADPKLRFQVEGHTDSDGGAAYNLGLSQRRAQAVVNDLATRYGIARSRLVAKGFGLTQPVASNADAAGKALNRRVELLRL